MSRAVAAFVVLALGAAAEPRPYRVGGYGGGYNAPYGVKDFGCQTYQKASWWNPWGKSGYLADCGKKEFSTAAGTSGPIPDTCNGAIELVNNTKYEATVVFVNTNGVDNTTTGSFDIINVVESGPLSLSFELRYSFFIQFNCIIDETTNTTAKCVSIDVLSPDDCMSTAIVMFKDVGNDCVPQAASLSIQEVCETPNPLKRRRGLLQTTSTSSSTSTTTTEPPSNTSTTSTTTAAPITIQVTTISGNFLFAGSSVSTSTTIPLPPGRK
jgi:hypothetical protein